MFKPVNLPSIDEKELMHKIGKYLNKKICLMQNCVPTQVNKEKFKFLLNNEERAESMLENNRQAITFEVNGCNRAGICERKVFLESQIGKGCNNHQVTCIKCK